jgi:hypothetical protein
MSHKIMKSELFVELSEQEQELVAGGFGPGLVGFLPVSPGSDLIGNSPISPGLIGGGFGSRTPFNNDGFDGFDGSPFN